MATCNIIFWSVVVPTTLYGCELWIMNDTSLDMIEDFQNHIGKRIQRFHPKIPNICSFYALGWMRLERIIQIRKLLFIRSIMVMQDDELPKKIFCDRAKCYLVMKTHSKVLFLTFLMYAQSLVSLMRLRVWLRGTVFFRKPSGNAWYGRRDGSLKTYTGELRNICIDILIF